MFINFIYGGCVCVFLEEDRFGDFLGVIRRFDVNFMDLMFIVVVLFWFEQVLSICGMVVGGEVLIQEVFNIWGGVIFVYNQYGFSECFINLIYCFYIDVNGDVVNIGISVGSVLWVVDFCDYN